jgi:hypothetical protein
MYEFSLAAAIECYGFRPARQVAPVPVAAKSGFLIPERNSIVRETVPDESGLRARRFEDKGKPQNKSRERSRKQGGLVQTRWVLFEMQLS